MSNHEVAIQRINYAKDNGTRYLDLSGLNLSSLPEEISELWQLSDLDISFNNLTEFPSVLLGMTNIRSLNVSHNYLTELPFTYGIYYLLKELDFSYNLFNFIPDGLDSLPELEDINFHGNPFHSSLPVELQKNDDIFYIRFYLESFKRDSVERRIFETKLLIVGKGEVGKTTLMKVISNPEYQVEVGKEETTHGINIDAFLFPVYFPARLPYYNPFFDFKDLCFEDGDGETVFVQGDQPYFDDWFYDDLDGYIHEVREPHLEVSTDFLVKKPVKVNVWDFGGQEILYSTHQFFLTQRSIYILVWEPRSDSYEENFDYWLNVIERLGKDSPVIIVMNKCDVSVKNIDEQRYREKFKNIIGFHRVSCLTKEGINNLMDDILQRVVELKHMGDQLPNRWDEIRDNLREQKSDYITLSDFRELCQIRDEKKLSYISSYLSDLGDIIHFSGDLRLRNLVITNPHWLTKAIYELIHSLEVQRNDGLLEAERLSELLDEKKYPSDKHLEILSLMERFEICFRVLGANNLYIIPALLKASPDNPTLITEFKVPEALKFQVIYEHMPSGIIERLICRLNTYLEKNNYWKYGAVFNNEDSRALVYVDKVKRKIQLFVLGELKTNLYTLIHSAITGIHNDLKLKESDSNELIACNCHECVVSNSPYMFEVKDLKKYLSKNKDSIDCRTSTDAVNIQELLIGYRKTGFEKNVLLREIVEAASKLQSRHKMLDGFNEDKINIYFQDLLRPGTTDNGLYTNEQSLKGSSESKKQSGELDINIETIDGKSITFFEGFILKSLDKTVIDKHIIKAITNYDSNGLKEKFAGVYCYASDFIGLVKKYQVYVNTINIEGIEFISIEDLSNIYMNGSEMKVLRSIYKRNDKRLILYHVLVNLKL